MIYLEGYAGKHIKVVRLLLFTAVMSFILIPAVINGMPDGIQQAAEKVTLTEEDRAAIVEQTALFMEENYVFPDKGRLIGNYIREQQRMGRYSSFDNPLDFADVVTADLKTKSTDSHLALEYNPVSTGTAVRRRQLNDPGFSIGYNFGFQKIERLTGNIGYLDLRGFDIDLNPEAKKTAVSAMSILANSRAIIIDLRKNPGGTGGMANMIASYFFGDEPIHLLSNTSRFKGKENTRESWTLKELEGRRLPNVPLYLLIGGGTASAAEHFVFGLKGQDRAVLLGETTAGAGHNVAYIPINEYFRCKVSIGRTYDPKTGEGWEGVGIKPHIEVPVEKALERAHLEALKALIAGSKNDTQKSELEWFFPIVKALYESVEVEGARLRTLAGKYGVRTFTYEDGGLFYSREGRRGSFRLMPISQDRFILPHIDNQILQFVSNSEGKVAELRILHQDGQVQNIPRDAE